MKIKIQSIEKDYPPYKMSNDGTLYSKGVKLDSGEWAKVNYYTEKINVVAGAEFIAGQNCDRIKEETKEYNKQDGTKGSYKQYSIYALKQEFKKGGGWSKIMRTEEQFNQAVRYCLNEIANVKEALKLENSTDIVSVFQSLFKYYCEGVKPNEVKQDVKADEQPKFEDQNSLGNDSDLPF